MSMIKRWGAKQKPDYDITEEILDYSLEIVKGVGRGLYGFAATAHYILTKPDEVVLAITQLAFDAIIITAAHMPPAHVNSSNELKRIRHSIRQEVSLYRNAVERMGHRWEYLKAVGQEWQEASGAKRAGMAAEVLTQVMAPSWVVKGAVKVHQLTGTGGRVLGYPTYYMPNSAEASFKPPSLPSLTAEQLRQRHTPQPGRPPGPDAKYPYVMLENGKMLIADRAVRLPANQNNLTAMLIDPVRLAEGQRVFAAGELTLSGATGELTVINNNVLWRFAQPAPKNFERLMRNMLPHNGFAEAIFDRIIPGYPPVHFQGGPPGGANLGRVIPWGVGQAAAGEIAGLESLVAGRGAAEAAVLAAHGHDVMHQLAHVAEIAIETARVGHEHAEERHHHMETHDNPPVKQNQQLNPIEQVVQEARNVQKEMAHVAERIASLPPLRPNVPLTEAQLAGSHSAVAHIQAVAQQVMHHNALFAMRNQYFQSLQHALSPSSSFSNLGGQREQRSILDAERYLKSMMYGATSVTSLEVKLRSYGFDLSSSKIRMMLDSASGITRLGDHIVTHASITNTAFANLLSSVGLSALYNSLHDVTFNALLRDLGVIGGVATNRGPIEGDIAQHSRIKVLLPGDRMPFSEEEFERILGELKKAIFTEEHQAYPFFSLEFNNAVNLYPVLHPCYQETLVGKVIAILDYYLKCFMNGVFYKEENFLETWHTHQNSDPAFLRLHLSKERLRGCPSLHEVLFDAGFEDEVEWDKKVRISFRILAKQGAPLQDGNIFRIQPDFDVEYTLDLSPSYQEEVDRYRLHHGYYPDAYTKLMAVCSRYSEIIHQEMPKLPVVENYFNMLGIISFACYYYDSLKLINKTPVASIPPSYPHFPKVLPPLPRRFYRTYTFSFTLRSILTGLSKAILNDFLYRAFMDGGGDSVRIKEEIFHSLHTMISRQVNSQDLDHRRIKKLSDKYFYIFLQGALQQAENLLSELIEAHNERVQLLFPEDDEDPFLYKEFFCHSVELMRKENGAVKWHYIEEKRRKAIAYLYETTEINLEKNLREERGKIDAARVNAERVADQNAAGNVAQRAIFAARINQAVQEDTARLTMAIEERRTKIRMIATEWEEGAMQVENHLKILSNLFSNEGLENPIEESYRHGVVDFPTPEEEKYQVRVVGGCGMMFSPLTPIQVSHSEELAAISKTISMQGFTKVTYKEVTYHGFSLASERRYEELEEESKYSEDDDDQKMISEQGYTPLMLDGLRNDDAKFTASLAASNPATRLVNDIDLLRMLILNKNEARALQVLDSGKLRDLDHYTKGDVTALHMALEYQLHTLAVRLIQRGASCTLPRYLDGYTPLHIAVFYQQREVLSAMQARRVNMNLPLPNGKTAMHLAAEEGYEPSFLAFLVKLGVNINAKDKEGDTALQCAIRAGHLEVALYLADHTGIRQTNKKEETASLVAARYGMFPVMERLLQRGENFNFGVSLVFATKPSIPLYIIKHGALQYFSRYQEKIPIDILFIGKKISQHGLLFHVQKVAREKGYKEELLKRAIILDDVSSFYSFYFRGKDYPQYHCLAAEWGSRDLARALTPELNGNGKAPLLSAIKGGDPQIFAFYWKQLEKSLVVEKDMPIDKEGNRLVHYAVQQGRVAILKKLYCFGHNIDIENNNGITPYQLAAFHNDNAIKALLKKYGAKEKKGVKADKKADASHECSKEQMQTMLDALQEGNLAKWKRVIRNRNALLFDGQPLLHYLLQLDATYQEEFALQAMKSLFSCYPIITKNKQNDPASFTLLMCENEGEVKKKIGWLKKSWPHYYKTFLSQTNEKGQDLCAMAMLTRRLFVLKALGTDSFSKKAFHYACMSGEVSVLQHVMQYYQDKSGAESFDEQYNTPMHLAASLGHTSIIEALLEWGVNPRLKNRQGELPLVVAIKEKQKDAADLLIDELGDTMVSGDLRDREGRTPFMWAAMRDEVSLMARFPRDKMYETDNNGATALHLASARGALKAIKKLLAWGADSNLGDVASGKDREEGLTPLHYAAKHRQIEAFRLLLEKGAEMDRVSNLGTTVAEYMIASKSEVMHHEMVQRELFLQKDVQQKLVKQAAISGNLLALQQLYLMGVPLDQHDHHGIPPIYYAVIYSRHQIVDFLLLHGCKVTQLMSNGEKKTLFAFAKDIEMRKILESYVGNENIPAFPTPLPTWSSGGEIRYGTPIPPNIKQGLSVEECALIERYPGEYPAEYYELALRIKKEFGLGKFMLLFVKKTSEKMTATEVMEMMHHLLTIEDSRKSQKDDVKTKRISRERLALQAALDEAWGLESRHMRVHLGKHYQHVLEKRNAARSPEEMITLFRTTNDLVTQPLSQEAAEKIAADYAIVLRYSEKMAPIQPALINIVKESNDPLEVIAAIRQIIISTLRVCPYDTQLFTLLALIGHSKVCLGQMQTGEGKSMVIAMMVAFYATRGKKVHVITTTQSLAQRDPKKYKKFYNTLSITTASIDEHSEDFSAQVIFGTQTDFEFALLGEKLCQPADVVIVDEVDGLLIDEGLNKARIAAQDDQDLSWLFSPYLEWIRQHEQFDEQEVRSLLEKINKEETDLLSAEKLESLFHYGKKALHHTEKVDYVIKDEKVVIVDYENTGSLHEGSRWNRGLHEFIEAKHGLPVQPSTMTIASISHIAFFKRYPIMIGLTGTLGSREEREELEQLYGATLFDIPPHFPNQRVNMGVQLCQNESSYYQQIVQALKVPQKDQRPVLILLQTIEESMTLSQRLRKEKIHHRCLNGVQQEEEGYLLEKAADFLGVTVATSAAGRGTDIILPFGCQVKGGLHVILGFLPYNERVERQGIGRAGRQGQNGSYEMIINMQNPFVQGLLKMHPRGKNITIEDLYIYRAMRVRLLSQMRRAEAEFSLLQHALFEDFSQMRRIVEGRLEGVERANCKEKLRNLWAEFFRDIEPLSLPHQEYYRRYDEFLKNKVQILPYFDGLVFERKYQAVFEEEGKIDGEERTPKTNSRKQNASDHIIEKLKQMITNKSCQEAINNKDFNLLLRKTAADVKQSQVLLFLLENKEVLKIDVKSRGATSGTAMDIAKKYENEQGVQMLKKHLT